MLLFSFVMNAFPRTISGFIHYDIVSIATDVFLTKRDSARSRLERTNTEMAQCKMWGNVCCSKDFVSLLFFFYLPV